MHEDMTIAVRFPDRVVMSSFQDFGFEDMGAKLPPGHGRWHKGDKEYHFIVNRGGVVWYYDCPRPVLMQASQASAEGGSTGQGSTDR